MLSSYTSFNTLFLSPFWLVAVLPVAVSVCRRFGQDNLSPFWHVAVLVCRRFDHTAIGVWCHAWECGAMRPYAVYNF